MSLQVSIKMNNVIELLPSLAFLCRISICEQVLHLKITSSLFGVETDQSQVFPQLLQEVV